jgi:hypothetical protein
MTPLKQHEAVGKKFGAITILDVYLKHNGRKNESYASCVCDCGTKFERTLFAIKSNKYKTKSCGCLQILGMVNRRKSKYGFEPIEKPTQAMIDAAARKNVKLRKKTCATI